MLFVSLYISVGVRFAQYVYYSLQSCLYYVAQQPSKHLAMNMSVQSTSHKKRSEAMDPDGNRIQNRSAGTPRHWRHWTLQGQFNRCIGQFSCTLFCLLIHYQLGRIPTLTTGMRKYAEECTD